ncbi:hypothetical protein HPB47_001363 [Ixodes persulcatus]|uniref:Uncharacterized protein n=1 Tax=Ixodes persulcatus TaxID=34615 RepID=A0AC60PQF1_IXOPE|nr:hypothetical protein HPB47_001363 [Ixodes persulcatus]
MLTPEVDLSGSNSLMMQLAPCEAEKISSARGSYSPIEDDVDVAAYVFVSSREDAASERDIRQPRGPSSPQASRVRSADTFA